MIPLDEAGWLARAFVLAERGLVTVRPNPAVGCVIVREGEIVGEGWHEYDGGPHAEDVALAEAGDAAEGASAYVTLEPCAHEGRTGSCAHALVTSGVARVVYAVGDPNPDASGGRSILEHGGVEVVGDVAPHRARVLNEVFFHVVETGRPFVTLKLAQSADGRTAAADGTSRWITSEGSRRRVHVLRAAADAVLVGSGTAIADDPRLDARHVAARAGQPRPVVLDARGRVDPDAEVVRRGGLVLTTDASPDGWRERIARDGEIAILPAGPAGGVDLAAALGYLHDSGMRALLVEGGPTLAASFVRDGLVDRLVLHVAPSLLGADGAAALDAIGVDNVEQRSHWELENVVRSGVDVELRLRPRRAVGSEGTLG